jgi:vacuolar-type H+-ATPase subunit I/STV1
METVIEAIPPMLNPVTNPTTATSLVEYTETVERLCKQLDRDKLFLLQQHVNALIVPEESSEAALPRAPEESSSALAKAEAQAKAVEEAKAAAEEEMRQLVQQHAAELREWKAALEVEKEKCYAVISAATSSHTAHAKALESLAAEAAADASAGIGVRR